jgi:hypothetical protein
VLLGAVTTGLRELLLARGENVDRLTLRASMPGPEGPAARRRR